MLITVGGPLLLLLSGCSSIDDLQRTHDVMATLQEADRQFTIESTPDGALPDDTQAKKWINDAIALMPHSDVPYVGTSDDPGKIDILGNRGRYPLLIDYLSKALKDPKLSGDYQLLLPLADAQERMGPQADASKTYTAALAAINKSFTTAGSTFTGDGGEVLDVGVGDHGWHRLIGCLLERGSVPDSGSRSRYDNQDEGKSSSR